MSTYRKIHGRSIQAVTTDPTGDITEGQVWYNTTSETFKTVLLSTAWASASPTVNSGAQGFGFGTQTAGVVGLGEQGPPGYTPATTEHYNGSGWSNSGNFPSTSYAIKGTGTQTAGLAAGGQPPATPATDKAFEYNGSSWSSETTMGQNKRSGGMFGIQTAAIYCGGSPSTPGLTNNTESYNGSSWSELNNMPVNKQTFATAGTSTAAIASGGRLAPGPSTNSTDEWDGTNWTAGPNLNSGRRYTQGFGIQTAALVCGGAEPAPTALALTELYDGTSWSETADLATARAFAGTSQNSSGNTAGWLAKGNNAVGTTFYNLTEEWNSSANVITAAAWSSIANFPDSRAYSGGSGGTPTSTLVFGGYTGPGLGGFVSSGAEFDGSSWTATGDYSIDVVGVAGLGPVTAGLGAGGYRDTATNVNSSYEYDGSSWTTGNNSNVAGQGAKMAGIQTAASMGNRSGDTDGHEQYDGTNWTAAANTPDASGAGSMMAGTQTALLKYGGEASGERNKTELFDGSSWTSGSNMNLDRRQGSHGGTQTYAIAGGGDSNPGIFGNTELWDGTSWASSVSMGTARFYQVGGTSVGPGGVTSNIAATGRTPGSTHSNNCEEFSSETIALNVKTLTQS
tara:strand:- start:19 stop:1887 length:1869 start_codon:yes stop_codon:yes gene_type:complete